jgi:hypothetical protein
MRYLSLSITALLVTALFLQSIIVGGAIVSSIFFGLGMGLLIIYLGFVSLRAFERYRSRVFLWVLFGLSCFLLIPYFSYVYVLLPVNFPPGEPFKDQLTVRFGPEKAQEKFQTYYELTEKWTDRYEQVRNSFQADPGESVRQRILNDTTAQMVERTDTVRSHVIRFLATHRVSFPEEYLDGGTELKPQVIHFMTLYNLELIGIDRLIHDGQIDKAGQQFRLVWESLLSQSSPPKSIIEHLVLLPNFERATRFYASHPQLRASIPREQMVKFLGEARRRLIVSGKQSLAWFYHGASRNFELIKEGKLTPGELIRMTYDINSWPTYLLDVKAEWPFYDHWASKCRFHGTLHKFSQFLEEPYYRISKDLRNHKNNLERTLVRWRSTGFPLVRNPVGRIYLISYMPDNLKLVFDTARVRATMAMLKGYLAHHSNPTGVSLPTDELTGKRYQVDIKSDTVVIRSAYDGPRRGRRPVQLSIRKSESKME